MKHNNITYSFKLIAVISALSLWLFGINAFAAGSNNESENNNTLEKADSISLSTDYFGTISSESDQDWFKFTTSSAGKYRIGLSGIPMDADYDIALYKTSSNCLETSISKNRYESICRNLSANTTYYIKIYSVSGYSTTEQYRLKISTTEQSREDWLYCFRGKKMASKISQPYIPNSRKGIDIIHSTYGEIANDYPVYSVKTGKVLFSATSMSSTAGWYVVIDLDSDYGDSETVRYLHLKNKPLVKTDASVTQGTALGIVGNTGESTGTHLHFDVNTAHAIYGGSGSNQINYNNTVDPEPYFETIVNFT